MQLLYVAVGYRKWLCDWPQRRRGHNPAFKQITNWKTPQKNPLWDTLPDFSLASVDVE